MFLSTAKDTFCIIQFLHISTSAITYLEWLRCLLVTTGDCDRWVLPTELETCTQSVWNESNEEEGWSFVCQSLCNEKIAPFIATATQLQDYLFTCTGLKTWLTHYKWDCFVLCPDFLDMKAFDITTQLVRCDPFMV